MQLYSFAVVLHAMTELQLRPSYPHVPFVLPSLDNVLHQRVLRVKKCIRQLDHAILCQRQTLEIITRG